MCAMPSNVYNTPIGRSVADESVPVPCLHLRGVYIDRNFVCVLIHSNVETFPAIYLSEHDGVIKWKHFSRYRPFVRGIHRSPVNSLHKGQWRGALIFSLICVWINGWVNNGDTGDLSRYRAHYDVTVMEQLGPTNSSNARTLTFNLLDWTNRLNGVTTDVILLVFFFTHTILKMEQLMQTLHSHTGYHRY